jgi:hypothetical protein
MHGAALRVKDEVEAWWRIQTLGIIENVVVLPADGFGLFSWSTGPLTRISHTTN